MRLFAVGLASNGSGTGGDKATQITKDVTITRSTASQPLTVFGEYSPARIFAASSSRHACTCARRSSSSATAPKAGNRCRSRMVPHFSRLFADRMVLSRTFLSSNDAAYASKRVLGVALGGVATASRSASSCARASSAFAFVALHELMRPH